MPHRSRKSVDDLAATRFGPSIAGEVVSHYILPLIALSMLIVFVLDVYTPLGVAVWVIYLIPITISLGQNRPSLPLWVGLLTTLLMIYTFFTDAPGIDARTAAINRICGLITIWIMSTVGHYSIRNRLYVARQQWMQVGRAHLSEAMGGEQRPDQFGDNVLRSLARHLNAQVAALFIEDEGRFHRVANYGVSDASMAIQSFTIGDGLLGQAVKDRRTLFLRDVPRGYLQITSSLGNHTPESLIIAPCITDGMINAVVEIGFLRDVEDQAEEFLNNMSESLAVAVRSGKYRLHLQRLLEETQAQAEELQVQSEELRVANEELETQSRALQESQTRLEQQQVELEQNNAQLEEQTQLLESQRDELARARAVVEVKANELERASRYKSEFLANMSHELRTPLNSTLILARLLADNPQGNLTEEQIKSAQTILASGNDLLLLINDILDLSKIEAGRMEIRNEPVPISALMRDLTNTFQPIALQRRLSFEVHHDSSLPEHLVGDRQRLEQILKNLLSNAFKFTERGSVTLTAKLVADKQVAFAVIDTGIGIPREHQQAIFEAFRQLDSAANRKYSGTGLGLSISRELTKLLRGDLTVESEVGKGTAFTLTLPLDMSSKLHDATDRPKTNDHEISLQIAAQLRKEPRVPNQSATIAPEHTLAARAAWQVEDDRHRLTANRRRILIVEDDVPFAKILLELSRQLDFECLIASTAEEAIVLAIQSHPSAIILDVGLPDQSGLTVLDRLKQDARTRHIPVHVISGNDYTETALALGAVGYMLKPVTRERLLETLKGLETRLVQRMRRVLVVEDDPIQLDSLCKLLGSQDVETIGAQSANECLTLLKNATFDCMVLDLSLPDASGYSLLETLSREDAYSFPPVIVYTGRDLSFEEEHQLRRYSKSIIIKGAKSPERLLDEVTLFLHQVVAELPVEQQKMIQQARSREAALEGRRILVVEDDVRNIFALTSILEPRGAIISIARNGVEALQILEAAENEGEPTVDLVLMDVMMPEMDGLSATRAIRQMDRWKKLPIIMLTAKAMKDDQEQCFAAGANDYMAKPLDVDRLLSLVRVWIRK